MVRSPYKSMIHRDRSPDFNKKCEEDRLGRDPISILVYEQNQGKEILC